MDQQERRIEQLVGQVAEALLARQWMLTTAESCTGGWVAKLCTDLTGSSQWFERGFVTYTNESKQEMLGVQADTLRTNGAVSEQTVAEMAEGALVHSRAQVSLSISGIAGPGGGTEEKPVGTVCFGWAFAGGKVVTERKRFDGDREGVRRKAVIHALEGVVHGLE